MIGCLTETTTCVVAKPLVLNKKIFYRIPFPLTPLELLVAQLGGERAIKVAV